MNAVYSVPASASLGAELDEAFPLRVRPDGTIGDRAHRDESSDHNLDDTPGSRTPHTDADTVPEVHARDVNRVLNRPGWTLERVCNIIVARHRAGVDNRLQNVIHSRRIASRSWGWAWRPYDRSDPHIEHAHFSFLYGSGPGWQNPENDTRPWGILEAVRAEQEALEVDFGDTKIKVSESSAEIFPRKKVGDEIAASEMLHLALIYAFRARKEADTATEQLEVVRGQLDEIKALLTPATDGAVRSGATG